MNRGRDSAAQRARPPQSFLQPLGDQCKDLVAPQVVERFMVSAFQKLQLAGLGSSRMELLAALEIDQPVTGPGKDQKWNLDVSREPEVFGGSALPLGVEPARDLAVNQRIGAVSGDHFGDT